MRLPVRERNQGCGGGRRSAIRAANTAGAQAVYRPYEMVHRRVPHHRGQSAEVDALLSQPLQKAEAVSAARTRTENARIGASGLDGDLAVAGISKERKRRARQARRRGSAAREPGNWAIPGRAGAPAVLPPGFVQCVHRTGPKIDARKSGKDQRRIAVRYDAHDSVCEQRVAAIDESGRQGGLACGDIARDQHRAFRRRDGARMQGKDAAHLQTGGKNRIDEAGERIPAVSRQRKTDHAVPPSETRQRAAPSMPIRKAPGAVCQ